MAEILMGEEAIPNFPPLNFDENEYRRTMDAKTVVRLARKRDMHAVQRKKMLKTESDLLIERLKPPVEPDVYRLSRPPKVGRKKKNCFLFLFLFLCF